MTLPFESIKRETLTRKAAETSEKYGRNPSERSVEELLQYGIVNVDKPKGPTSHQVSAYAKDILHVKRAGHAGTLDPGVTGVLPVALGRATRIVQLLLTAGKEYMALMHLHRDVEGKIIRGRCEEFVGAITQLPPVKSSVKRQHRVRMIYGLDILEIEGKDVLFHVSSQAGTYIRKLIDDIGKTIGGAHMAELRRVKAGPFDEKSLATLQELRDAYYYWKEEGNDKHLRKTVLPMETAVAHLPKVWVMDSAVNSLVHGASLKVPGIAKVHSGIAKDDIVAIMTLKDELIGYGNAALGSSDMLGDKGVAVKTRKVFMAPGIYPKVEA